MKLTWQELKKDLFVQGLHESFIDPIDDNTIANAECDNCGYGSLHPVAFRGNGRYLVYGVCLKCNHYIEI